MRYIIGDIGNTSTKICILNHKFKILKSYDCETYNIYKKNYLKKIIQKQLKNNLNPILLFSSVVPHVFREIKKKFKSTKYKIFEIKKFDLRKIIKIKVKNIKQLGSDRIVNAIGARNYKNCIIIDFGTATTFDIINNYAYEGGVIAPGVALSIKNLSKAAALLPAINLRYNKKSFGKNTVDALNAGFVWGYEGLISNIISKIVSRKRSKYKIILTGGYANFFKKTIKGKVLIDQNITVKGIAKVYKELV